MTSMCYSLICTVQRRQLSGILSVGDAAVAPPCAEMFSDRHDFNLTCDSRVNDREIPYGIISLKTEQSSSLSLLVFVKLVYWQLLSLSCRTVALVVLFMVSEPFFKFRLSCPIIDKHPIFKNVQFSILFLTFLRFPVKRIYRLYMITEDGAFLESGIHTLLKHSKVDVK